MEWCGAWKEVLVPAVLHLLPKKCSKEHPKFIHVTPCLHKQRSYMEYHLYKKHQIKYLCKLQCIIIRFVYGGQVLEPSASYNSLLFVSLIFRA